jgi:hypothetical protein
MSASVPNWSFKSGKSQPTDCACYSLETSHFETVDDIGLTSMAWKSSREFLFSDDLRPDPREQPGNEANQEIRRLDEHKTVRWEPFLRPDGK